MKQNLKNTSTMKVESVFIAPFNCPVSSVSSYNKRSMNPALNIPSCKAILGWTKVWQNSWCCAVLRLYRTCEVLRRGVEIQLLSGFCPPETLGTSGQPVFIALQWVMVFCSNSRTETDYGAIFIVLLNLPLLRVEMKSAGERHGTL
jgi:hypothetical protein